MNLYNDIDPGVCEWQRRLIAGSLIPDGDVVCKSITELTHEEIKGYHQQHYFSGIAGWPSALYLAGWRWPAWTASLPCQPFSLAGNNEGFADPRAQLWQPFLKLLQLEQPLVIFGEQVEAAIGKGWVDRVQADMEAAGYTFGFVVLGAHSIGAPHRRQRIFWVAHRKDADWRSQLEAREQECRWSGLAGGGWVGHAGGMRCDSRLSRNGGDEEEAGSAHRRIVDRPGDAVGVADRQQQGLQGHAGNGDNRNQPGWEQSKSGRPTAASGGGMGNPNRERGWLQHRGIQGAEGEGWGQQHANGIRSGNAGFWSNYEIAHFRDGSIRRIEPGLAPMVARLPKGMVYGSDPSEPVDAQATQEARILRIKGYGNSIIPALGAVFVSVFMETNQLK